MEKSNKEVLELCKAWFEDIMERCDRLTSGNVSHGRAAIRGMAKNYAEFVDEHLQRTNNPNANSVQVYNGCVTSGMLVENFKKNMEG